MYALIGDFKKKLAIIIAAYAFGSMLNILSIIFELNTISASAYNVQYCIFLTCFAMCLILIRDGAYVLSFGRANDYMFILSVRILAFLLVLVSVFSIFYMKAKYSVVEFLQYIFVLSLNIIFSQEIKRLLLKRKLLG